jgi:hypothetical protein
MLLLLLLLLLCIHDDDVTGAQIEKDVSDSHPLASVYIYNSFSFSLLGI